VHNQWDGEKVRGLHEDAVQYASEMCRMLYHLSGERREDGVRPLGVLEWRIPRRQVFRVL